MMSAYYVGNNTVEVSGLKVLKRGKHPNEWIVTVKGWECKLDDKTGALYVRFKKQPWSKVHLSRTNT